MEAARDAGDLLYLDEFQENVLNQTSFFWSGQVALPAEEPAQA